MALALTVGDCYFFPLQPLRPIRAAPRCPLGDAAKRPTSACVAGIN